MNSAQYQIEARNWLADLWLLVACAITLGGSIVLCVFAYYAFEPRAPWPEPFESALVVVFLAPIPLLLAAVLDIARARKPNLKAWCYASVFGTTLLFHPVAQTLAGLDMEYAESLRERATALNVVGKSEREVVRLLGPPTYVLPREGFPDEKQLRYRHPFPMFIGAEFFVSIKDGRARWMHIDDAG
jgi:hypothetical protein